MKQVAGLISTYSSDEFGICSVLYELGGMVVMHDASGCNSTYTTHDEPRWYDIDSMIFISAISEMEAVMGDDEKLIKDLIETAKELQPAFIAIVGAPIPYMIGTDLKAIATVVEEHTKIPSFGFAANGMQNYLVGASMATEMLVKRFCKREAVQSKEFSVNILGATPLDFSLNGSVDSMKEWLEKEGMNVQSCFTMGSTLNEIEQAGQANVNLVVSYGGLAAAEEMKRLFQIPYVAGVPIGEAFALNLAKKLKDAGKTGKSMIAYADRETRQADEDTLLIIGESIFSESLAAAITLETGRETKVACPLETTKELLTATDCQTFEEDDLICEIKKVTHVIADPLYRAIVPTDKVFYPLPHEAFSGRIYDSVNPDLINRKLSEIPHDNGGKPC